MIWVIMKVNQQHNSNKSSDHHRIKWVQILQGLKWFKSSVLNEKAFHKKGIEIDNKTYLEGESWKDRNYKLNADNLDIGSIKHHYCPTFKKKTCMTATHHWELLFFLKVSP